RRQAQGIGEFVLAGGKLAAVDGGRVIQDLHLAGGVGDAQLGVVDARSQGEVADVVGTRLQAQRAHDHVVDQNLDLRFLLQEKAAAHRRLGHAVGLQVEVLGEGDAAGG